MTEEQIKHMVNRFLDWKLPRNFNPDGNDPCQAEDMVRYIIQDMPYPDIPEKWKQIVKEAAKEDGIEDYCLNLSSLVNGVATYTLTFDDNPEEILTFPDAVSAHEYIHNKRIQKRAEAIFKTIFPLIEAQQNRIEELEKITKIFEENWLINYNDLLKEINLLQERKLIRK